MRTVEFELKKTCADTRARLGVVTTPHGPINTPAFMPVGTAGTVKSMLPQEVEQTGAQIILGNTFHLYLRPGHQIVKKLGGLHKFAAWPGSILTDSGGFQVLSLREIRDIKEEGVLFRSPYDGSKHLMTPELSVEIQEALGTDIAMAFDECPPHDATRAYVESSMHMTTRWLDRCTAARAHPEKTSLFAIVQGGRFEDLRREHARTLVDRDFDGYAIGGVAVGESRDQILRVVDFTAPELPVDKPRYLMGVGYPRDLLDAVKMGIDMFDCVIPTRSARTGRLFTETGWFNIKVAANRDSDRPIDEKCQCPTCKTFSRGYLRHLWMAKELLVHRLTTMHNLYFFQEWMRQIRNAIAEDRFGAFYAEWKDKAAAAPVLKD